MRGCSVLVRKLLGVPISMLPSRFEDVGPNSPLSDIANSSDEPPRLRGEFNVADLSIFVNLNVKTRNVINIKTIFYISDIDSPIFEILISLFTTT